MHDAIVIGGGPGGYSAALRVAQLGGKVLLIEKSELGGVCTNKGCIPTKALIASAEVFDKVKNSEWYGVKSGSAEVDYKTVAERRDRIVATSRKGVELILKKAGVEVVKGAAKLKSKDTVEVEGREINAKNIIIATGSEPKKILGLEPDGKFILSSDDVVKLSELPKSVLVVGGGIIGVEYASLFQKLGCSVVLVELMDRLLPNEDEDISTELQKILGKGIEINLKSKVESVDRNSGTVNVSTPGDVKSYKVDAVLVSVGRTPLFPEGLDKAGIKCDKAGVKTDERMRTSANGVYAVGDVTGKHQLAHVAAAEGVVAAENCMGKNAKMSYECVPWGIFNIPEIGRVGLTEAEARGRNGTAKVGKALYAANGKANCIGEREGLCKVVCTKDNTIVGVHIIGAHASDLIAEAALAVKKRMNASEVAQTIHSHPTLPEIFKEACENALQSS
ncbi:MAG: dihydrolipoyl dehydrogenase [Candidatus Altiarchaeota archaeon]|nr:dihydrolipoyl dehydrogenase [Candidatus Altiarchaeota archaeon]